MRLQSHWQQHYADKHHWQQRHWQRELQAAIAAGLTGVSDIGDCRQGTALECPAPEARQVHAYANTGAFFNMITPTDGGKPTNYLATDN